MALFPIPERNVSSSKLPSWLLRYRRLSSKSRCVTLRSCHPSPSTAAPDVVLRRPFDVVCHHQVEITVLVVVEPARAGGPCAVIGNPGFSGHISERAIPVVVVEDRAAIAGDI